MSTAVPLPLDTVYHDAVLAGATTDAGANESQALRRAVTERLEQHRKRRGGVAGGDLAGARPRTDGGAAWPAAKPNRVADSVAARFAKSQSYREFLQEEAEAATRQAEAAAEIARRTADAVAAAQQQLLEEMRAWEERQFAAVPAGASDAASDAGRAVMMEILPEAPAVESFGELVAMPLSNAETRRAAVDDAPVVRLLVNEAAQELSVLAPPEAGREAVAVEMAVPEAVAVTVASSAPPAAAISRVPETLFGVRLADVPAVEGFAAAPAPVEPVEPPTPIPANLIEFPRQLVAARKARPRLAEGPLREEADLQPERAQLRIFEVEASSFSTVPAAEPVSSLPEWSSIHLDSSTAPHETVQPDAQVSLALPVYAAPLERRVMAAAVDGCCVATAFLLAVAAAGLAGDALPTGMFAVGASAATLLLFGVGYLLLSFTLSGQTVGMRYARIALCTFGDDNPSRAAMRRRLFAMGLSAVSLGLGFLWALLDDEKLGWHDRISRMYQRAY